MTAQPTDQNPEAVTLDTEQASTNFYWTFGKQEVFNLQTTIRSQLTDAQITAHLDTVKRSLLAVDKMGGKAKAVATPGASTKATTAAGNTQAPPPAGQKAPTPTTPANGKAVQSFVATQMEVMPKPDGKAEVKFYAEGHKYPDLYATKTVTQWIDTLKECGAWETSHFAAATMYACDMRVDWVESDNLNKNGKPYHNLVSLHLAG